MKFRKGDQVKITAGKDKGKTGKIEQVFSKTGMILIPGVNMYKRHRKPTGAGKPSGIIDIVKPLPLSNVALVCPKCNLPTRVGFVIDGKNKRRICRKCGGEI